MTSNFLYQMNEKNLGVCFAPSLFHLCGTKEDPSSPKRQKRTPMNKASKELTDNLVRISTMHVLYHFSTFLILPSISLKFIVLEQQILQSVTTVDFSSFLQRHNKRNMKMLKTFLRFQNGGIAKINNKNRPKTLPYLKTVCFIT